ncbi:MAG: HAMP domain-containing sensor histidine kinase [Gemmatimonadaceae bacterium]
MKVVTKLRAAFALYITLLGVLLIYHVSTVRRSVETGHKLTELTSRVRATSTVQVTRVAQLSENAAKYAVTNDSGYLDKFRQLANAYASELHHVQSLSLSGGEQQEVGILTSEWESLGDPTARLASLGKVESYAERQDSLSVFQSALDALQLQTQRVGEATQAVMGEELERSASAATLAEQVSLLAAIGILFLTVVISAIIARSISEPLHRLTEGTHRVAEGQFDYRLDTTRNDEFSQVARAFNTMTRRLGELDSMKRDFVTGVSHDLKTPLTSMQETISVLLDELPGKLTDKQRTLLLLNRESGDRLAGMLAKLLNLSRLEAGLEPDLQVTDGAQLLRRAVGQVEGARNERGLGIDLVLPDHRLLIECDYDRILQVLDNLLENAVKFSPADGTVTVKMESVMDRPAEILPARWGLVHAKRKQASVMWITVADEGPGVPDTEKERIFDRFYQTTSGRAVRERGVGLGLAICREIVSAHGGAIWLADNPAGDGSVMNVLLPGAFRASPDSNMHAEASANQTLTAQ